MSAKQTPLFTPGSVRGFASAQDPKCLPPGMLNYSENLRMGDGLIRARWSDSEIASTLEGDFQGACEATLDGKRFLFRAAAVGRIPPNVGDTRIYQSVDGGSTWAEITSADGQYGSTRFGGGTSRPVGFAIIKDLARSPYTEYDTLAIFFEGQQPLIYAQAREDSGAFTPGSFGIAPVVQPPAPTIGPNFQVFPAFANFFELGDPTGIVLHADDATKFSIGDTFGLLIGVITNFTPGPAAPKISATFPTAVNLSKSNQFVLVGGGSDASVWKKMQITLTDTSGNQLTVFDPVAGIGDQFLIERDEVHFIEQIAYVLPQSEIFDFAHVNKITFGYTEDVSNSSTVKYQVFLLAGGGMYPGGTGFSASYACSDSRQIGPSSVYRSAGLGAAELSGGTRTFVGTPQGLIYSIEDNGAFFYDYVVTIPNPTTFQRNSGIDRAYLFAALPGQTLYTQVGDMQLAHWDIVTSTWVFNSGSDGSAVRFNQADLFEQDVSQLDPGSDAVVLPKGTCAVVGNARTFVGVGSRIWFNDADGGLSRFRKAARGSDESSGSSSSFSGETIQQIVTVGDFGAAAEDLTTPVSGVGSIFVITDSNLRMLSGFFASSLSKAISVAPYGTLSPQSVGRSHLGFYYLDQFGQVVWYSASGINRLSLSSVDNLTIPIPRNRKAWVWGACAKDRYYLAFSSDGETNDRILVWDERVDRWESVDTVSDSAEALIPYYSDSEVRLLRFSTGGVSEHEKFGCTASVDLNVTFGELVAPMMRIVMNSMTIWADGAASPYQLLCRRRDPSTGTNVDGYCRFPNAQRSVRIEEPGKGLLGDSIQPSISGSVPGGTRIHGVWANVDTAPWGAQPSV